MAGCKIITASKKEQSVNLPQNYDREFVLPSVIPAISAVTPERTITTAVTQPCVQYQATGMGEDWLPDPKLFKYLPHVIAVSEAVGKAFSKSAVDIVGFADLKAFSLAKSLQDAAMLAELRTSLLGKAVLDVTALSDGYLLSIGRSISEVSDVSDASVLQTATVRTDTSHIFDAPFKHIKLVFPKADYFLSDYFISDYFYKAVQTSDTLLPFHIGKGLSDIVDATDDFYGAANVDDDQYAYVDKRLVDWTAVVDQFSRQVNYYREYQDNLVLSEGLSSAVSLIKEDTSSLTDVVTLLLNIRRFFEETLSLSDSTALQINPVLFDTAATSESKSFATFKALSDLALTSEALALQTASVLAEALVANDAFDRIVSYNRNVADAVDATDDFYGAANVDDDQYALFSKLLVHTSTAVDTFSRIAAYYREFSDSASTTETLASSVSKLLVHTSTTVDILSRIATYYRAFNDAVNTSEVRSFGISKLLVHTSTAVDTFSRIAIYYREFNDSVNTSEVRSSGISKSYFESLVATDTRYQFLQKSMADGIGADEALTLYHQNYFLSDYFATGIEGRYFGTISTI